MSYGSEWLTPDLSSLTLIPAFSFAWSLVPLVPARSVAGFGGTHGRNPAQHPSEHDGH
jgi:hypothetical protein